MEVQTVPSLYNPYIPSGLSTLSSWPLHDDVIHRTRHPTPSPTASSTIAVVSVSRRLPERGGLTLALRTDQKMSNLYVDTPRCPSLPPRAATMSSGLLSPGTSVLSSPIAAPVIQIVPSSETNRTSELYFYHCTKVVFNIALKFHKLNVFVDPPVHS